jgi:hypothetical protein
LSLEAGINENSLFTFTRALKAFEITHDRRLPADELDGAFSLWWTAAKPQLPGDADFDEYRLDFLDKFAKTKAALGSNSREEATRFRRKRDATPALKSNGSWPSVSNFNCSRETVRFSSVCVMRRRSPGCATQRGLRYC